MIENDELDANLVMSEIYLLLIPKQKFQLHSWQIFDEFMSYAVDTIAVAVGTLIKFGYLEIIKEEVSAIKFLGIKLSSNLDYVIQRTEKPIEKLIIGWLEEKVIVQFKDSQPKSFTQIIYRVLNEIFQGETNNTNPGKILIFEISKHQKLNLFEISQKAGWFSQCISVHLIQNRWSEVSPKVVTVDELNLPDKEIFVMKKIIGKQLGKFQNLD